jgi:protein-S-isoprenylcysteine O-methyltransferase Ste14
MNGQQKIITLRVVVLMLFFVVVGPLLPLLISWRWGWWEAWAFAAAGILSFAASRLLAARSNPDLITERSRYMQHEDTKSWDKFLSVLLGLGGILMPLVAGLDKRFGWSTGFNLTVELIALAVILIGYVISSYALIENRFFSGVVRIQTDRGQHVVSGGPYRWVRHPGYAGALLAYLATPLLLGSVWTYLPVVFSVIVLVIRTALEDRTLQVELPGYKEYTTHTRYRLLPGVW